MYVLCGQENLIYTEKERESGNVRVAVPEPEFPAQPYPPLTSYIERWTYDMHHLTFLHDDNLIKKRKFPSKADSQPK